jgi:ABC-type dipeptide/oligopeptide/nickel transport system permease component
MGLPYLPTVGMFDPQVGKTTLELIKHMILPVATLAIISVAGYSRFVRSSHARSVESGLRPHRPRKGIGTLGSGLAPCA